MNSKKPHIDFIIIQRGRYTDLEMRVDSVIVGCSKWSSYEESYYKLEDIFDENIHPNDKLAFIEHFFIKKEFRGQGYSHKLIKETLVQIRAENHNRHIALIAESFDAGVNNSTLQRMYKKYGFKLTLLTNGNETTRFMCIYKKRYKKK